MIGKNKKTRPDPCSLPGLLTQILALEHRFECGLFWAPKGENLSDLLVSGQCRVQPSSSFGLPHVIGDLVFVCLTIFHVCCLNVEAIPPQANLAPFSEAPLMVGLGAGPQVKSLQRDRQCLG